MNAHPQAPTTDPEPDPEEGASAPPPPPPWKRALVWLERVVTVGLLLFIAVRLGPQIGALVGFSGFPSRAASAPAFMLATLDGDTVRSADLAGKVVVVNFWATWCAPCRLEMPSLEKVHERHAAEGLVVLGVSMDRGGDAGVRDFLAERGITYAVGLATPELRRAFGPIPGIPTTFVIDRTGRIRHRVIGYLTPPALEAAVSRLLRAEDPSVSAGRAGVR